MARDFPNTNASFLNVGDVAALDITGTALTISAWLDIDTAPVAFGHLVGKVGGTFSTGFMYALQLTSGGRLEAAIFDAAGEDKATGATDIRGDGWVHACMRKNGTGAGALQIWLNGASDGSVTSNRSIPNTSAAFRIGNSTFSVSNYMDGRVAEVGVWNVAITDAEIVSLARGFAPIFVRPQSLQGYFPLVGNASTEPDLRNSNNASVNGTVAAAAHPRIIVPRPVIYIP